jgi:hypothetical protein
MNTNISRLDLIAVAVIAASLALVANRFSPAARSVETRSALAIVVSPPKEISTQNDPDATVPDAVPDPNNWHPEDGQSRYGDKTSPDDDQDDDDDDLDDSYDPPGPDDVTPA